MGIRIKVDEDLPGDFVPILRSAGHDALSVLEQDLGGTSDDSLWPLIQREHRCLFTADKGFADARAHPPGTHAGVVLFRLPRESRSGYLRLVEFLIAEFVLDEAAGAIVVVSPDAIRIHRPGPDE